MKDKKKCTSKKIVKSFFIKREVQCEKEENHDGEHYKVTLCGEHKWTTEVESDN